VTEVNEKIQPSGAPKSAQEASAEQYSCDWSKCKKDHPKKLEYPGGGNVERGSGLRGALFDKNQQPWADGNYGVGTKPIYFANGKIKRNSQTGTPFTDYQVEAHHLVPIDQMSKTSTLKSNAILAGWNIDDIKNGIMLPKQEIDIAIHELQQHSGSHPASYTAPIMDELKSIEQAYEDICEETEDVNLQLTLNVELDALSALATDKILGMRQHAGGNYWALHNSSVQSFKDAIAEYARRRALNAESE
jgi:hypothetical protein